MMRPLHSCPPAHRQHGVVLIITLIGLVVLLLAGVSLTRSVDTASMIAGNMAFKLSTVASGDAAMFAAAGPMQQLENLSAGDSRGMWIDSLHPLNNNAAGYYATIDANRNGIEDINNVEGVNLMGAAWTTPLVTAESAPDAVGNTYSYIIQRMYRGAVGVIPTQLDVLTNEIKNAGGDPKEVSPKPPPPKSGNSMVYRITMRIRGPRNSTSYIQAFVY